MGYIDIAIPLAVGLLLVLRPQLFAPKAQSGSQAENKIALIRKIGLLLLAVAAIYAVIAFVGPTASGPA